LNLKDNKCKIYFFRPFECQLYPFLINRNAGKAFLAVDLKCPFVKQRLETKEFKEYTKNLSGILNSPSLIKILKNNPQIIQAYPEALNLRELNF
jgi:Fe-S-cluster containining protein